MSGIKEELQAQGIRTCGADEDNHTEYKGKFDNDPEVGAVVIGLDTAVNYVKYAKAFTYLRNNPDCHFILTNGDTTYPTDGAILPGAGSIASPIIKALKRDPDVILGKPAQNMLETIFAEYNLDPKRTCMVGDRLDTDIEFGVKGGIETLCVLTGVTSEDEVLSATSECRPVYYMDSFAEFAPQ